MNSLIEIHDYAGNALTDNSKNLLNMISLHDFSAITTGSAKKTIQIKRGMEQVGYINSDVTRNGGIFGYHFVNENKNSCPDSFSIDAFAKKYHCLSNNFLILKNSKGSYLLILDLATALQILLSDAYL